MNLVELGARRDGRAEQRVPCPQCDRGPKDDALGVNIETGAYHCFRCGYKGRVGGESSAPERRIVPIDDPRLQQRKRDRLRRTWRESVPLANPKAWAVRRYLDSRGLGAILDAPPLVLRAHPALEYWERGALLFGKFPAMVALFAGSDGAPRVLHRTWLRSDGYGKAPVPTPKKLMEVPIKQATAGGAIRLHEPHRGVLGIAEGIESALSLHILQRIPVWAASSAGNLKGVRLPEVLHELQIGVDLDESGTGERAAEDLARRVTGWHRGARVFLVRPAIVGFGDLNDELRGQRT